MTNCRTPPFDTMRSYCICLLTLMLVGCRPGTPDTTSDDDAKIAKRVSSWPAYRAPRVVEMGMLPGDRPILEASLAQPPSYRPTWEVIPKQEWDMNTTIADSLARIGEAAVPKLIESLRSRDMEQRLRAARILARIGPAAKSAVPDLVHALSDPRDEIRKAAALALGQIGPAAAGAVDSLVQAMESDDRPPRRTVAPVSFP